MSPDHMNTDRLTVAIAAPIPEGIAEHLTALRPGATVVNVGRGTVIDEPALASPHTAALSAHEDRRIAEVFARNVTRRLDGEELLNQVDVKEFS